MDVIGFDLFFKLAVGNVPRAKVWPNHFLLCGGLVDSSRALFGGAELVCGIARDTSADSARTSPTPGCAALYPPHQRHALGWSEAKRDYDPAGHLGKLGEFSRSKEFYFARPALVAFFGAAGD
jgi:hypothetical protein